MGRLMYLIAALPLLLVFVGGIEHGIVGLTGLLGTEWSLVETLAMGSDTIAQVIKTLVGISTLLSIPGIGILSTVIMGE